MTQPEGGGAPRPINRSLSNTHKGAMMRKLRLSFTLIAIAASIVAATVIFTTVGLAQAPTTPAKKAAGGHLYMQTNEVKNAIIHYHWSANGTLAEVERVATGAAASGELSPIYHINRPNDFHGARSGLLTPDLRLLFPPNSRDNPASTSPLHHHLPPH